MTKETDVLLQYINDVKHSTQAGKIEWVKANPTTFVWSPAGKGAKVFLQRVAGTYKYTNPDTGTPILRKGPRVFLNVTEMKSGNTMISIDGADSNDINEELQKLYDEISLSLSKRAIDFLKSLLPNEGDET